MTFAPSLLVLPLALLMVGCGEDSSPSASAGTGGIGGGTLTSSSAGTSGTGGAGSGGAGSLAAGSTCEVACRNARACLSDSSLCPNGSAADGAAIEAGCLELCGAAAEDFEALSEDASRCGQALSVLVDGSELASGANRSALERCAPSGNCQLACEAVSFCAVNACENLGVNGSNVYAACIPRCAADESWAAALYETRNTRGCVVALTGYAQDAPGDLPAGCPED